jgi:hypothetical protein
MNDSHLEELQLRAAFEAEPMDRVRRLEARSRVYGEIEKMKAEGKVLELSEEEEKVIVSFRRFKLRMRKDGEVFTWQTRRPEGIQIVDETANILHPEEAV